MYSLRYVSAAIGCALEVCAMSAQFWEMTMYNVQFEQVIAFAEGLIGQHKCTALDFGHIYLSLRVYQGIPIEAKFQLRAELIAVKVGCARVMYTRVIHRIN